MARLNVTPDGRLQTGEEEHTTVHIHRSGKPIAAVRLPAAASLADLRERMAAELDAGDLPADFRFEVDGAPCALKQEAARRVTPSVALLCKDVPTLQAMPPEFMAQLQALLDNKPETTTTTPSTAEAPPPPISVITPAEQARRERLAQLKSKRRSFTAGDTPPASPLQAQADRRRSHATSRRPSSLAARKLSWAAKPAALSIDEDQPSQPHTARSELSEVSLAEGESVDTLTTESVETVRESESVQSLQSLPEDKPATPKLQQQQQQQPGTPKNKPKTPGGGKKRGKKKKGKRENRPRLLPGLVSLTQDDDEMLTAEDLRPFLEQPDKLFRVGTTTSADLALSEEDYALHTDEGLTLAQPARETLLNVRCWELVPSRVPDEWPRYLREVELGRVPTTVDFADSTARVEHFRCSFALAALEEWVADDWDGEIHMRRQDFMLRVGMDVAARALFEVLCNWAPVVDAVDSNRFGKMAREMGLSDKLRSSEVDLAFTKCKKPNVRKINAKMLAKALVALAQPWCPRRPPQTMVAHMSSYNEEFGAAVWREAKRLAMLEEGRRWCAQTRIGALMRRHLALHYVERRWQGAISIQTKYRQYQAKSLVHVLRTRRELERKRKEEERLAEIRRQEEAARREKERRERAEREERERLERERLARVHAAAAVCIQKEARRFVYRRSYLRELARIEHEAAVAAAQRLAQQKEARALREQNTLLKQARRVNGRLLAVRVMLKSRNKGVVVHAYEPESCTAFQRALTRDEMKNLIGDELGDKGKISNNELFLADNLRLLLNRLTCRISRGRCIIQFSKRGRTNQGVEIYRHGRNLGGRRFVLSAYSNLGDLTLQAYEPTSSLSMTTHLSAKDISNWWRSVECPTVLEEEEEEPEEEEEAEPEEEVPESNQEGDDQSQSEDEDEEPQDHDQDPQPKEEESIVVALTQGTPPDVLTRENRYQLLPWILERLHLCPPSNCGLSGHAEAHHRGEPMLILEYQLKEQARQEKVMKIQAAWRAYKGRCRALAKLALVVRKRWDPDNECFYYMNTRSGEASWAAPYLLHGGDFPDPPDSWEREVDAWGNVYYVNPLNGRVSWISTDQAACRIQGMLRRKRGQDYAMPSVAEIGKALKFQRIAVSNFVDAPEKLSAIVNYALYKHVILHDYSTETKRLYQKGLDMAPTNPVALRAYSVFLLASVDFPRESSWARAHELLKRADKTDVTGKKFQSAERHFFQWAIILGPRDAEALLNYALLLQSVHGDFDKAETYYRRAIEVDPGSTRITRNYEDFCVQRLPGGLYAGGGPGHIVRRRAVLLLDDGEWHKYQDPEPRDERFALFWFNSLSSLSTWEEPSWPQVWKQRKRRAEHVEVLGDFDVYADHKLDSALFYVHKNTGACQWERPYE